MGLGQGGTPTDAPVVDTAEQVYISSLALLKMLKHGRAGEERERDEDARTRFSSQQHT
jgi:26S proteasome regulatory subunit N11